MKLTQLLKKMFDIKPEDPIWLQHAKQFIGITEIAGPKHNESVLEFWKLVKLSGIKDDETAWCAAFVGAMLEKSGIKSTRSEAARSYLTYGIQCKPTVGAIAVFDRSTSTKAWLGHVGFVVGEDSSGNLLILGGNQGNAVNVKAFSRHRLITCVWPLEQPLKQYLPLLTSADLSTTEA
jgi:uncharacterized protein (TIGR02594 family)